MRYPKAVSRLNQTCLGVFQVSALVRVGTVETPITGIRSSRYGDAGIGVVEFRDRDLRIEFISEEFSATGAKAGDTVVLDGAMYAIVGPPEPDEGGMTACMLRRRG